MRSMALEFTLAYTDEPAGKNGGAHMGTYLLTFCPPGPDERLNDMSHMFRGIVVLALKVFSHSLPA